MESPIQDALQLTRGQHRIQPQSSLPRRGLPGRGGSKESLKVLLQVRQGGLPWAACRSETAEELAWPALQKRRQG